MTDVTQDTFLTKNIKIIPGATLTQTRTVKADVEKWLERLPLLDVGRTSQQLLLFLTELSVADIADSTRLELLDPARKPVSSITNSLSKHYFTQKVQLTELAERIFTLNIEFKSLQAQMYFYIAQRLADNLQTFNAGLLGINKKKNLQNEVTLAIHRAMSELSGILLDYQMLYRAAPKKAWARLHYLLSLAAKLDIHLNSAFDNNLQFARKSTISQVYSRAIIMSLLNSGKVKQAEMTTLWTLSEGWAELVSISHQPNDNSLLMINPYDDTPPTYIEKNLHAGIQVHYVDVSLITAYLQSTRFLDPNSSLHSTESQLSGALVSHLTELFSTPIERIDSRQPIANSSVHMAFGITSIHYYLSGQVEFKAQNDLSSDSSTMDLIETSNLKLISKSATNFKTVEQHPIFECDVHNTSTGGLGLSWNKMHEITGLKSGELVIYKHTNEDKWDIGVVRWISKKTNTAVEFGVQLLSHEVTPCTVCVQPRNEANEALLRGLLLSDTERKLAPLSVITQGYSFKASQRITVKFPEKSMQITLSQSILDTGSFVQFLFAVQDVHNNNPVDTQITQAFKEEIATNAAAGEKDLAQYDDLWSEI